MMLLKKTEYNKLVRKVNNTDTSGFVLKTKYNTDKTELDSKIPDISNLATKTALTTVENKIPSVSNLVKKQTIILKLQKLKIKLMIIITINILILSSLIL